MLKTNETNQVLFIDINKVFPDSEQPRKYFDTQHLQNLQHSIQTLTQIDPILVRRDEDSPGRFIIVDGERRWRAIKDLSGTQIKCLVIDKDSEAYEIISLTKNIHRVDLLPIEKALAISKLLQKMKGENEKVRQRQLIEKVNLSETYISELLKMSSLEEYIVKEAVKSKHWTGYKLLQLAKIKNREQRKEKFEEMKIKITEKIQKKSNNRINGNQTKEDLRQTNQTKLNNKLKSLNKHMYILIQYLDKTDTDSLDDLIRTDFLAYLNILSEKFNLNASKISSRIKGKVPK
jgi:ParB family chromosome partitioning protein